MSNVAKKLGLSKGARSPGSISNVQHHDASGACKELGGIPGTIKEIFNDTAEHAIGAHCTIRVHNPGGVAYIWIGDSGEAPGTVDANTGFAIPAGAVELFHCGVPSAANKSVAFKCSSAMQVVVTE